MKDIKTYIEKEVKLLNTQSGGGRELTHFGKGAKHAFLKVLDKIKEIEAVKEIEVVEPTELRKEFEGDFNAGDRVVVLKNSEFTGTVCIVGCTDEDGFVLLRVEGGAQTFFEHKSNLKKL